MPFCLFSAMFQFEQTAGNGPVYYDCLKRETGGGNMLNFFSVNPIGEGKRLLFYLVIFVKHIK